MIRTLLTTALFATTVAGTAHAASAADVWDVQIDQERAGLRLTCRSKQLTVDFTEQQAWTLGHIVYRDKELVGQYGANGSVVNARPRPGDEVQDPWIGTGHGREEIRELQLVIDGRPREIEAGAAYAGRAVLLRKRSGLGPLDHEAEIALSPEGNRLTERHAYRVVEPLDERFNFVYAYMHCNRNALRRWLAVVADDRRLEGRAGRGDREFQLRRDIRAIAFYSPEDEVGVAYVYPQLYQGARKFRHSIWDRPADNKLYFRPEVSAERYEAGDRFDFVLSVVPFAADEAQWKEAAAEVFAAPVSTK
jgi:hypothetical protein